MPIKAKVVAPFMTLAKFTAHKNQFSTRVSIHVTIKQSEVCKLLPIIARHFIYKRAFTIYYLIMRKWQYKLFAKSIYETKSDLPLVKTSVNRLFMEVIQGIVHPA